VIRLAALLALLFIGSAAAQAPVVVFAAASLKEALDEYNAGFGLPVKAAYAASSALARQIEAGAPAQVFVSADEEWMDYVERKGLLQPGTRRDVVANRLVWIVPAARAASAEPLAALGPRDRLALADPQHVPAGKYARAALEKMGAWPRVAGRIAAAENVRAALALVARGECPVGIVYETDARAEPKVRVAATIDPRLHPRIVYPAAALRGASPAALRYLDGMAQSRVFERHGFARP
jgi:molybdate transport system substrate-binding protein